MKTMLGKAIAFATEKHDGQFDRGGHPYILHCLKVMHYTRTDNEEVLCAAVLHDVVEDCNVTYADLREIGMSETVINAVRCLTKVPGETEEEYKSKVMSNSISVVVKKADLRHNSDIRRIKNKEITDKDIKRTIKYQKFYIELDNLGVG